MSEPAAAIVERDRRLALARLDLVIESMVTVPSAVAGELASFWATASSSLTARIGQPFLEEWIADAEHVIATGVHRRYPDVHLARLVDGLKTIATTDEQPRLADDPIVAELLDSLGAGERTLVETTFVAATCVTPDAPWIAGLLRYGVDLDADSLVAAAHADLARRESRLEALFGAPATADGLDLGHGLRLRKTRRGDRQRVEDWSALDALVMLSDRDVEALSAEPLGEAGAYLTAIRAYRLGEFEVCVQALERCLSDDNDVEEYWCLLAFAQRHLRCRVSFERIIFSRQRDLALIR